MRVSVVTPSFNEEANLPVMYERLSKVFAGAGVDWEWIVVDDHSKDRTYPVAQALHERDPRVRVFRLAHNSGSHAAMICGFRMAKGDCAVLMAADLQDPPETIPGLLAKWNAGAHVVWAVRRERIKESAINVLGSRLFHFVMRRFVGIREMPARGADFFLVSRTVLRALARFHESNASMLALITWMGFPQDSIEYDKQARLHGRSGWNFEKRIKYAVDSVTSFSYFPIRLMSYAGFLVALLGFLYAVGIIFNLYSGHRPEGWASLMVVVVVIGGIQMLMIGVLGEYLWRTLEESRRRPIYLVEASTDKDWDLDPV